jgi:hypothetical protein
MARFKFVLPVIVLLLFVFGGYHYYNANLKIVPEKLLQEALTNTVGANSYRYHVKLQMQVDGRTVELSDLDGEKANGKDFHIVGTMQEQQIEVYQIGNVTYLKDGVSGKWVVVPENPVFETEYFMAEINPMSSFNFTGIKNLRYLGIEKHDRQKYYVLECTPGINNDFLTRFWQDFKYKLWIDKGSKKLVKAEVQANNKAKPSDSLSMLVELKDFNAKIKLIAPIK